MVSAARPVLGRMAARFVNVGGARSYSSIARVTGTRSINATGASSLSCLSSSITAVAGNSGKKQHQQQNHKKEGRRHDNRASRLNFRNMNKNHYRKTGLTSSTGTAITSNVTKKQIKINDTIGSNMIHDPKKASSSSTSGLFLWKRLRLPLRKNSNKN